MQIDIDYKISFDDNDGLISKWDNYFDKLVKFLSSDGHIKDKKIKTMVDNVRKTPDLSESKYFIHFSHISIHSRYVNFLLGVRINCVFFLY